MNDLIRRQGLLKRLEEKSGMNTPEWLVETINEEPGIEIEEPVLACAVELLRVAAKVGGEKDDPGRNQDHV